MASDIELYNTMLSNNSNITYHSNSLNIKSAMVLETYSVGYGANLEIGKLKISGSSGNALSVYSSVRLKVNKIDIEYTNGGIYLDNKSFSQISNINIENMLKSNNNTTYDYPYLSIDGHNLSLGTRKHSYVDINTSNINMYNVQLIRTNDRTYKDYVKLNGNNNSILNITILGNSKYIENEYIKTYENGGHGNGLYISGSNNIIDFVNIIGITGFGSNYDKNLNNYALSINDVGSNNVVKYVIIDYSRKNSINSNNLIENMDTINNIEIN